MRVAVTTLVISGLVGVQQTDDWDRPNGEHPAYRRTDQRFGNPTTAINTPPPACPAGTGLFVKNAQSMDDAPFTTRSPRISTRASTAIRDSMTTSAVIARLTS